MPKLLDVRSFCENLKEVSSTKMNDKRKFHPNGLFSEQIFGPLKNYTCQCGTYYGISRSGGKCDTCQVDIVNSDERRRRFARITLPFKVVNPIMYDLVVDVGGSYIKNFLDILMKNDKSSLCKDDDGYFVTAAPVRPEITEKWEKTEAIYEIVKRVAEENADKNAGWKIILDNIENLLMQYVIVLPPELRPASKGVQKNNQVVDKINKYYMQIITKKELMRGTVLRVEDDKSLFYNFYKQLQKDVNELHEHIMEKLSKKEGLLRGNILGKRVDFSGRAVIIPEPSIGLNECVLPYIMILELFKVKIAKRLIQLGKFKMLNKAIDHVDDCIDLKDPSLYKICEEIIKNEVCILNRQPSLHRLGMLGFNIKMSLDDVIKIHPLVCSPFNADFDGDQMAVYIPISDETKEEVRDKFLVSKNLTSPANENLTVTPSQDIVLGIYTLTTHKFPNMQNKVLYKEKEVTEDIKLFNECFPKSFRLIDEEVGKDKLIEILNEIKDKYDSETTKDVLDKVKETGFKYSTLYGTTMSLGGFIMTDTEMIKENIYTGEIMEQLTKLSSKETEDLIKENFEYSYLVSSGARGKWDQVRQIVLTRGFISNFSCEILKVPVKHSLLNGLTPEEFFNSTYGCRKGLLDVAVNTGESGFLSRKLVFTCVNLTKSKTLDDCGTKDFLDVFVDSEKKSLMLIDRYYEKDKTLEKITKENYKDIVGKIIKVRSPILCQNEEICHICYGDLYKHLHSEFIGVIAAQSLGETNTQLILRVFHSSLRKNVEVIDINGNSHTIEQVYDIVKSGKDFYTFSCSPEGVVVVSKVIDAHKDRIEKRMVRVTLDNDKVVESTLDHEWIMRDGSCKDAKDLTVGDSLMPIYFGPLTDGYRTVIQNKKSKFHKNYKKDKIFKLSSEHQDSIKHDRLNYSKKITRHYIDKNKWNDYPNNIMIMNEGQHLREHSIDSINSPNRINTKIAVSKSNKRRTKDSEWVRKFSKKRNETMSITYPIEKHIKNVKKWYEENPEMKVYLSTKARLTTATIVIDKVKELNLELTNINYENVRKSFGSKGKHYLTFKYVKRVYPELVGDFKVIFIEKEYKSPNQLQAEYRVNLILNKIKELNLEINETNFDQINCQIYPNVKTRWRRPAMEKFSPGCLSLLQNNHKITKVEFIDLPDYEEFYDLTVDSKYPNFALSAGIFIHNSGVAVIEKDQVDMKQADIIGDLSSISRLLHVKSKDKLHENLSDFTAKLFSTYNSSRDIHHVHIECVVSQMMWKGDRKWRLMENRSQIIPEFFSVQTAPEKESWILGLGFSYPKKHILRGIKNSGNYTGIFDRIMYGEKFY